MATNSVFQRTDVPVAMASGAPGSSCPLSSAAERSSIKLGSFWGAWLTFVGCVHATSELPWCSPKAAGSWAPANDRIWTSTHPSYAQQETKSMHAS